MASTQVLKHRDAKGLSLLPTVARLMSGRSAHAQALAAQIIWDLCVKCRRDWGAQAHGNKPKSVAATKRATGRKSTVQVDIL